MWYNNWQQMYICEDTTPEPQWAEYEEIIEEEEQGMSAKHSSTFGARREMEK